MYPPSPPFVFLNFGKTEVQGEIVVCCCVFLEQVIASIESSPEILAQVQEVIIPVIQFTLEHKLLGTSLFEFLFILYIVH